MIQISGIRRFSCAVTTLFLLFALVCSVASSAQSTMNAVTDLQFHKFQPKVDPHQAAESASSHDLSQKVNGMSVFAARQINALQQEKLSRTPAQQKIDSNVLYTLRMLAGQPAAPGVPYLDTGVDLDANNNIVVDMVANVTESLLGKLSSTGAKVLYSNVGLRSIRAVLAPDTIEGIAASPDVIFISPRQESRNNRSTLAPSGSGVSNLHLAPGFGERVQTVRQRLAHALSTPGTPITWQGSVGTEGDLTHQTFDARGIYGINGAGLKIGVLSDGVTSSALSQATGDLPPTCGTPPCLTVLSGQVGTGDEGTAILEIIHDMVPGASLYFATANTSLTSFAANIAALQAAGCQIIVDDVFYFVETPFQDGQTAAVVSTSQGGIVTQAVNDAVAKGVFYFSSAGNEGNLDIGSSGTFEGDFVPQAAASPLPTGSVHNFGSGNGFDTVTSQGEQVVGLWWTDPLGGSQNDYDLYLLDDTGASIQAASTNIQNGTQDPVELIESASVVNSSRLVVFQNTGAANRFFHLVVFRGTLGVATSGETHGHSAASGAYTVAATPAAAAFGPPTPNGPYPAPFNSTNQIEFFSSDGLRHIFFNSDSTAITPGNFSSTGGSVLDKPDLTAADGVSVTAVGGFDSPFYGTSAAAPAAASVAALVVSADPAITAAEMKTALNSNAIDIMAPGFDRDSGNGIVMALPAIASLGVAGGANLELATITASENPGNGNGIIEAGEGALLQIQLKNAIGVEAATNISATLTSSTPGVTILQPAVSAYADMAAGAGPESNLSPFEFSLTDNIPCGLLVDFTLTITYSGGQTRALKFSVQTGMLTVTNTLGSTPTLPSTITFATGTQTNRIDRNGVTSSCGTPKAFPGVLAGSHSFDSYTFQACRAMCLEPQLNAGAAGVNLLESLYTPSFNPSNIATNYSGDPGASNSIQTFGVDLAANTDYTVVIDDIAGNPLPPPAPPNTYTIQIPSCAFSCNPYPLPIALAHDVSVTAATTGGSANANVDNGSNDPDGGAITITQLPAGPYPQGNTSVTLTVTNKFGAFAQANATVKVNEPTPPTAILGESVLTFTPQLITTPSPAQSVSVTNSGQAPLHLSITPSISGTNPSDFAIASGTTCTSTTPVAGSGGSCIVNVIFTPKAVGARSANLVFTDDATPATQTVTLNGTGAQAPTFVSANKSMFTVGTAGSFTVTTNGFPAAALTETGALPAGVSFVDNGNGTATLSGTPAAGTSGIYPITITAANGILPNGTQSFTLTVEQTSTTTQATNASIAFSASSQSVALLATVSSSGGTVNAGTVTFTVLSGSTPVGSATTASVNAGAANVLYTLPAATGAGTYTIQAVYNAGGPFATSSDNSHRLTVGKATATVTLGGLSQTYTGSPLSATATTTPANLPVTFTYNGSAAGPTAAGSYTVTGTINDPNYQGAATSTLVIAKATETLSWSPASSLTYGTSLSGLLNATASLNNASLPGAFAYTATPSGGAPTTVSSATVLMAGGYTLTATFTPSDTTNFNSASITAPLTIRQATLTLTATNASRIYGTANPVFTGSVTGQQNGDSFTESFNTTASVLSSVGAYPIVPSITGARLSDYTQVVNDGTLTIGQAGTTTTLDVSSTSITPLQSVKLTASVASATSGTPTGTVTFFDGTSQLGTAELSGRTASYTAAGLTPGLTHTLTATYGGGTNFTSSNATTSVSVTVAPLDFTMTIKGPSSESVVPGNTTTYQVTVAPKYGTYAGEVNFAVNGLPTGAAVTFSPASIAANGGPQTVTVTIQTAPATATVLQPSTGSHIYQFALAFLLLIGTGAMRRQRRNLRRMLTVGLIVLAAAAAIGLSGCGGTSGFFAQAPQNYTVTITATSDNLQHTAAVTLNVQ